MTVAPEWDKSKNLWKKFSRKSASGTPVAKSTNVISSPFTNQACSSAVVVNEAGKNSLQSFLKRNAFALFIVFLAVNLAGRNSPADVITDNNPLAMPDIGSHGLRILSPNILELTLISTKAKDPARVSAWDFVNDQFVANLPAPSAFAVTVDGAAVAVQSVGADRWGR